MILDPLSRRNRYLLAALSGALLGLAFPPTGLPGGLLAFIGFVPMLIALESADSLRKTFYTSFIAMFVFGIVANYWVGAWSSPNADKFLRMGGVILAVVHPFFLLVPFLLYDMMRRRFGRTVALYSLPIFQAGFEYAHSFGDLAYPWLNLYNTQTYNLAYIQFIELTGPYLLSMIIVLVNVEIFQLIRGEESKIKHSIALLLLIAIPYLHGWHELGEHEASRSSARITILQPNIDPWAKWNSDAQRIMDSNFSTTETALRACHDSTDLLLWPETAVTFYITRPQFEPQRRRLLELAVHHPLLTGFPDWQEYQEGRDSIPEDANYTGVNGFYYRSWNAAMLLYMQFGADSTRTDTWGYQPHIEVYHKQKLVPLGERVPFIQSIPFLAKLFKWSVGLGSWNVGEGYEPLAMPLASQHDSLRITPTICYESIYPSFVRHFVDRGANVLAVITNDGWYGFSSGPYQHEQFAVLRAIEDRRWVVRSANTGISAVIDDRGRTVKTLPLFVSGSITERVPLIERKTWYVRLGDVIAIPAMMFSLLCWLYGLTTWFISRRRRKTLQLL